MWLCVLVRAGPGLLRRRREARGGKRAGKGSEVVGSDWDPRGIGRGRGAEVSTS